MLTTYLISIIVDYERPPPKAADASGIEFNLTARCEVYYAKNNNCLDEAIDRLNAYRLVRELGSKGQPMVGTISFKNDLHCRSWGGKDKCSTVGLYREFL